jgi:biotin transport system substrate-specific component
MRSGPLDHGLGGHGLGRLGAHLVRLGHERPGLLLRVGTLTAAGPLVGLALGQVLLPAQVVHVDRGPVGVQVIDLVDHGLQQIGVVGDDQEAAVVVDEEVAQPAHGVRVEVVRRLVQQQRVRVGVEDARQLHTAALAAGERADGLGQDAFGQIQVVADGGGLGLGGVPAAGQELGLELVVAAHGLGAHGLVLAGHVLLTAAQLLRDLVEATGGEDAGAGQLLHVGQVRVLRQVAQRTGTGDLAACRERLTRQDLGQRGLAGTVAADEADLVSCVDPEVHLVHQQAGTCPQFKVGYGDHSFGPVLSYGVGGQPDQSSGATSATEAFRGVMSPTRRVERCSSRVVRMSTSASAAPKRSTLPRDLALIVVFAAVVAALSLTPAIPVGAAGVPITLQTLGVAITGLLLGGWRGFTAVALYVVLGLAGLPIFAQYSSGFGVLAGGTAGYLLSFPVAALVSGSLATLVLRKARRLQALWLFCCVFASSILIIHPAGIIGMKVNIPFDTWGAAFMADWPFWPGDVIKCALAAIIAAGVFKAFPALTARRTRDL